MVSSILIRPQKHFDLGNNHLHAPHPDTLFPVVLVSPDAGKGIIFRVVTAVSPGVKFSARRFPHFPARRNASRPRKDQFGWVCSQKLTRSKMVG